jgi:DNA (cytosine-5)-methyltransferase 1
VNVGSQLTVGSLFTGIGGFDLGLERAGMRVVWQCETDDYCRRVLARRFPGIRCHPDVRRLRGADLPPVDVLAAGWPCPGFSYAGRGEGFDHAGSGLWTEIIRLVPDLRPRYVVLENVSALLARGLGRVLGDLAAIGYDAEWDCIPASAVGAPHRRDRVWVVAYPDRAGSQGHREPLAGAGKQPVTAGRAAPGGLADADGARPAHLREGQAGSAINRRDRWGNPFGDGGQSGGASGSWWATEPDVGRVAHGIPNRVDRLRSLGNALVPQIAEWIGHRILEHERR